MNWNPGGVEEFLSRRDVIRSLTSRILSKFSVGRCSVVPRVPIEESESEVDSWVPVDKMSRSVGLMPTA